MTPTPPIPSRHYGRTAWLVMVSGLVASALMIGIATYATEFGATVDKKIINSIVEFAVRVAFVISLWSISLAARGLYRGEHSLSPTIALNVASILAAATGAYCFWHPDYKTKSGVELLPVLLSFEGVACVTGTWTVKFVIWRMECHREKHNLPARTTRERMQRALAIGAIYTLLLGVVTLPVLLFLWSALWPGNGLRGTIAKRTPNFIRDVAEGLAFDLSQGNYEHHYFHGYLDSPCGWLSIAESEMLCNGRVSAERLNQRILDSNGRNDWNWGFRQRYPKQGADYAEKILCDPDARKKADALSKRMAGTRDAITSCLFELLGQFGSREQRRNALKRLATEDDLFKWHFFRGMQNGPRDEALVPDLEDYLLHAQYDRDDALMPILAWLPKDQAKKRIHVLLYSSDAVIQNAALSNTMENLHLNFVARVEALDHPDPVIRRRALFYSVSGFKNLLTNIQRLALVKRLVLFLSCDDVVQKRGAARWIGDLFWRNDHIRELNRDWIKPPGARADPKSHVTVLDGGTPLSETDDEKQTFPLLRAHIEQWLDQQESLLQAKRIP